MWNPNKIEIYNLFAHKESIYEFKNNSCTVIFGKNETDRGLENNGAGKTTLFEGISIALTNESLRGLKKESFINREEEDCRIVFFLSNPVLNMTLKIERQFYRGNKPVKIEIWENDKLNKQVVSVNEANRRILELIGISREDLLRYFIISQDSRYTFFTASDSEKKEIMNRITSADMVNPVVEELDLKYKEENLKYNDINDEVSKLYSKRELFDEQRQEMLGIDNTEEEIKDINNKESILKEESEEIDICLKKYKETLKVIKESISSITFEDVSELKKKKKNIQLKFDELETEILENKRVGKELKSLLDDTVTCPKCKHEFIRESELDLSVPEAKKLLKENEEDIKKQQRKLEEINKSIKILKDTISKSEQKKEIYDSFIEDKVSLERKINRKKEEKNEITEKIARLKEEREFLKKRKKDNKLLNSLNNKIEECDKSIKEMTQKLIPLTEEIETIKYWQFNMGKSGFQTYLANKSVKIIEGMTNSYLRKFGVDISILINGFTILKSGEVREKIDIFVLNDGVTAETFMSKSGGERGRVALAGVLGIQHLINMSLGGRGLNLLLFDECFHGMDGRGQESIIKIFEKMNQTIMVITQNVSESFNNENTLYVVKEKGISKYVDV